MRLFTEEVDKITSLVIGLSSRLAKASLLPAGQQDEKLQVIIVILLLMLMLMLMPPSSLLASRTRSCR